MQGGVCKNNELVILSLSFFLSALCGIMKDSSFLQRDGFSSKTAESEEKRAKDEKKRRTVGRHVW